MVEVIFILFPLMFLGIIAFLVYRFIKTLPFMIHEIKNMPTEEKNKIKEDFKKSFTDGIKIFIRHIGMFK